ncbi:hypothetical protein LINGRAHAP2_LOCUS6296 [Linum grandiflorum]
MSPQSSPSTFFSLKPRAPTPCFPLSRSTSSLA